MFLVFPFVFFFSVAAFADSQKAVIPFKPVTTQHTIKIKGAVLSYHATVGVMPIYNNKNQLMTTMSYIAYVADIKNKTRPVTFVWAGGPGASSLTDNFLMSGPKTINVNATTKTATLATNANTWLPFTDLVYIDMAGTGWGRVNSASSKTVYSPWGDATTFSVFIQNYLQKQDRVNSPIYILGESYGGFRAPLVVNNLLKQSIRVKGMILLSPLLTNDYQLADSGNNISYPLDIPTYIRTALYFHRLSAALQKNPEKTVREGTQWAITQYPYYLLMGDSLSKKEETALVNTLSQYTGLSQAVIRNNHYRIYNYHFATEFLGSENKRLDFLDTRHIDNNINHAYGLYILHIGTLMSTYLTMYPLAMHDLFHDLGVNTTENYINYFSPGWNYQKINQTISVLHDDLVVNPEMKVLVGVGYYDNSVPYFRTETALNQLLLPENLRKNITLQYYEAGHLFYTDPKAGPLFFENVKKFYKHRSE